MKKNLSLAMVAVGLGMAFSGCSADTGGEDAELGASLEASKGHHWGNRDFQLSSCEFADGDPLPYSATCEGVIFGAGSSPALNWTKGPKGTKSYAIVLIDQSIATNPTANLNRAYHWAIWDIHHSIHALPSGLAAGTQIFEELKGAQQLSSRAATPYQYFGPCPSWPTFCYGDARTTDSYTFTIYALPDKNTELPAKDPAITNYVRQLAGHFQSLALAETSIHFTSDAAPNAFPTPPGCPPR